MNNELRRRLRAAPAVVTVCVLAALSLVGACAPFGARDDQPAENSHRNGGGNTSSAATNDAASANRSATAAVNTSGAAKFPVSEDVDLQANHPNGAVLRLTNVTFNQDSIAISLAVTNGHKNEIRLNDHQMLLRDNAGNRYNLSPPPQNPDVRVPAGNTLDGKFVFLGRINPAATSLTLTTNDRYGSDTEYTTRPKLTINNIPVRK